MAAVMSDILVPPMMPCIAHDGVCAPMAIHVCTIALIYTILHTIIIIIIATCVVAMQVVSRQHKSCGR